MTLDAATLEQIPYSAQFARSTWVANPTDFRARAPVTSPSQAVKIERNLRMSEYLNQAITESADEGLSPAASAVENFDALLRLLPSDLPLTDPYVSDAGSVCLDWDANPTCQLSVMLKANHQIAFAAYFRGEKVHGSARFSDQQLPESFLGIAERWINMARHRG
jgi:hypothetical protein